MLGSLRLQNFKCFEDQSINFGCLTLLSGLNSTGKSSIIQSLLLLRQSYQQGLLQETGLDLNGSLIQIGTAKDALFEGASEEKIAFELTLVNNMSAKWQFNYDREADVLGLDAPVVNSSIYDTSLFNDDFQYLQAERIGPRTSFEMSDFQVRQHENIGSKGEYAAHFLEIFGGIDIPNQDLGHSKAASLNLKIQVESWMGEISPGTRINLTSHAGMDLMNLQYSFVVGNQGFSNPYRPTNVGFGITYTLPIIVAILSMKAGGLILIENPEAHLHPGGQSKMGYLLALAASCGVQVILETHSDHVLNGIRLAVYSRYLKHENANLYYLQRSESSDQVTPTVISPKLDEEGLIDKWPDGFFDQTQKDLLRLI
jgi:predicted ATPase